MPSALAWNKSPHTSTAGQYELLLPGEAKTFQVYDDEFDTYRILLVMCDDSDLNTRIYEFERTDEINMDTDIRELDELCVNMEPWEEIVSGKCFEADTFASPTEAVTLFIGHQATMSMS